LFEEIYANKRWTFLSYNYFYFIINQFNKVNISVAFYFNYEINFSYTNNK